MTTLRNLAVFFISSLFLVFGCHGPDELPSTSRSVPSLAKVALIDGRFWLELKVPIRPRGEAWKLSFITKTPDDFSGRHHPPGFSTESTAHETVFRWIIPEQLELWFGTDGYLVDLVNASGSQRLTIKLLEDAPDVSQWKIGILPSESKSLQK
ncbi:MAG: hypothetical protein HYR61_10435 [Acidobacteria bacterium]|nr:hypothetical protein [Acidobacteriota bacterium]